MTQDGRRLRKGRGVRWMKNSKNKQVPGPQHTLQKEREVKKRGGRHEVAPTPKSMGCDSGPFVVVPGPSAQLT